MSLQDLKTAIRLHRTGRLAAAHDVYCNLVGESPTDANLISLLGQLELQMGKTDAAIGHLRQAASLAPQNARIMLTLARGLAATGHHGEAISIAHRMLAEDDASADAWSALATVHRHHGDHVNELVALERATELVPDDVPTLIAQANAQVANGYLEKAIETLRLAAGLAPDNPRIANNLGALYLRRHNLEAAEIAFQQALRIAPDYAVAVSNLAATLHRMGKLEAARDAAERAQKLLPNNANIRAELAAILTTQGDLAGAEAVLKTGLELAPDDETVLAGLAELREKQGRSSEGLRLLSNVMNANQASPNTRLVGASLAHRMGRREIVLQMLNPLLDNDGDPKDTLDRVTRKRLGFLLGDIYDASADYGTALRHYTTANSVLQPDYDVQKLYNYVDSIIESFDAASFPAAEAAVTREPRRLFIVGMPRSGVGLLNSMLVRHPAVHTCGELSLLRRLLTENGDFPAGFSKLSEAELIRCGDRYCAATASPPGTRWAVDKMPLNFFYLGAIAATIPDALIIHCNRYPADTLLSCYFQNFSDPALAFSFDIENLGHFWRNYNRLMRHWQGIMGDRIVDLHYEELVASPEASMRQLIDRLNLDWDWEVLHPKPRGRHSGTAAKAVADQHINIRSVGRFARYRPFWGEREDLTALQESGPQQPGN